MSIAFVGREETKQPKPTLGRRAKMGKISRFLAFKRHSDDKEDPSPLTDDDLAKRGRMSEEEARRALDHFEADHATLEEDCRPRFTCGACGTPGLGLHHICASCDGQDRLLLHRFCQRRPATGDCVIHPDLAHNMVCVWSGLRTPLGRCAACGKRITPGRWRYECEGDSECRVHLTCYLIQATNNHIPFGPRFCPHGHWLTKVGFDGVGHYTCATCGTWGLGPRLRCKVCCGGSHHPFCIDSARCPIERKCFKHRSIGGSEHAMRWTPPPARPEVLVCGLCLRKVEGWHYQCALEVRTVVHPVCAQLLREDRRFEVATEFLDRFFCLLARFTRFCQPAD